MADINIRSREVRRHVRSGQCMAAVNMCPVLRDGGGSSDLGALEPLFVHQLMPNCENSGKLLIGTVSSLALPMSGIHMILRDYRNEYVVTSVYDFLSTSDMSADFLLSVDSYFHLGVKIGIKNPFYKISLDGKYNIRIDNPDDLVFLSNDWSVNRKQGNKLFKFAIADHVFEIMPHIGDVCKLVHSPETHTIHVTTVAALVFDFACKFHTFACRSPLPGFSQDESNEFFLALSNRSACFESDCKNLCLTSQLLTQSATKTTH